MSKSVLRTAASVVAIGAMFAPLPGIALLGVKVGVGALLSTGIALGSSLLLKPGRRARPSPEATDRLHVSLDPDAPRKIVFGRTAMATDLRYAAYTGTDQEYYHQILCVASHEAEAEEIWFDSERVWTLAGGVIAKYAAYLQVTPRNVGTPANGIAIDAIWTASCTLTGCSYLHLRFKRTGATKKAESPFAQSIPTRVTIRGKGMKVYDQRFDSTAGGSGTQRIADQTTWAWSTGGVDSFREPALQTLAYLLGWRINGKLAVGRGIPPARIDTGSFLTGANVCDETVTKAGGGTEPRYRSDGVVSEADDPTAVTGSLCAAMNAVLRDSGGRISLHVLKNDLGTPKAAFSEDDALGDESWIQTPRIDETFNVVRGRYTDPSDAALYQLVDYPEVSLASVDGIERVDAFELAMVQSPSQAQRLAKQRLQRNQYQGVYTGTFNARAWQVSVGDVVTFSHASLGWTSKLFRVVGQTIRADGTVPLVLQEENAAIYAWDAEERPAVVAAAPTIYDPAKAPVVAHLNTVDESATRTGGERSINRNGDFSLVTGGLPVGWSYGTGGHTGVPAVFAHSYSTRGPNIMDLPAKTYATNELVSVTAAETIYFDYAFLTSADRSGGGGPSWWFGIEFYSDEGVTQVASRFIGGSGAIVTSGTPTTFTLAQGRQAATATLAVPAGAKRARIVAGFELSAAGSGAKGVVDYAEIHRDEPGSTQARSIGYGPSTIIVEYDHTLTAKSEQLPRPEIYKLFKRGVAVTSGLSWSYKVLSGTVNGFTSASGAQALSGAGAVTLTISSVGTDEATIELTATEMGVPTVLPIALKRVKDAPPSGGSSGGGTGGNSASDNTLAAVTDTTGNVVSDELQITMGSTQTAATLAAAMSLVPTSPRTATGTWNCAFKWQRWNGASWVDVNAEVNSDPDPQVVLDEGTYLPEGGSATCNTTATGLTAGSTQKFRLYGRNTTGSRSISISGTASAQG